MNKLEKDSSHNWRRYMELSDECYRKANSKCNSDLSELANHNLVVGGEIELRTVFSIITGRWGVKPAGKALDLCCGAGAMTKCLYHLGLEATGMDLNTDAIELARKNFVDCRFLVGDATDPAPALMGENFDLILVREAHPFSRINDIEFQIATIDCYLSILNPGGFLIIAHARFGGDMSYPSLDFGLASRLLIGRGVLTAGPLFLALIKRFGGKNPGPIWCNSLSFLARCIQRVFSLRIIEAYIVHKPVK